MAAVRADGPLFFRVQLFCQHVNALLRLFGLHQQGINYLLRRFLAIFRGYMLAARPWCMAYSMRPGPQKCPPARRAPGPARAEFSLVILFHCGLARPSLPRAGRIGRIGGGNCNVLQKFGKVFIHIRALPFWFFAKLLRAVCCAGLNSSFYRTLCGFVNLGRCARKSRKQQHPGRKFIRYRLRVSHISKNSISPNTATRATVAPCARLRAARAAATHSPASSASCTARVAYAVRPRCCLPG